MRLIDADKLIEVLRKSHEYHAETSRDRTLLERDIRLVKEQPTVVDIRGDEIILNLMKMF